MPWEQPLQQILQSIEGPVAKIVAVIIIIATGLALAFGDTSGWFPPPDPDRVRPLHRLCGQLVLPVVLLVQRRGARLMTGVADQVVEVPGFLQFRCIGRCPSRSCSAARARSRS